MTVHIASLIVRSRPEFADAVAARIARRAGNEVHAVEAGKVIVVLELPSERALADRMDEIRNEPDVLMVSLVYHQEDGQEQGPKDEGAPFA